jgi:sodium/potassium-transporting ATPase subunit alpha
MTVEHVWYDDLKRKAKNRELFGPSEVYEYDIEDPSFKSLQECAIISSEARFEGPITVNTKYIDMPTVGDASETGLIKFF